MVDWIKHIAKELQKLEVGLEAGIQLESFRATQELENIKP